MTTRRQFLSLAGAALATPALPRLATRRRAGRQAADPRDDPVLGRQHASTSSGASCSSRSRASSARPSWSRTAAAPAARSGPPPVAKAEPDGYYDPDQRLRAFRRPGGLSEHRLRSGARFLRRHPVRHHPQRDGDRAREGHQDAPGAGGGRQGGSLTYASAGVGSATHWAAERLRVSAGFQAVHVPFRGGPEALTEVMTGRVDFTCMGMAAALGFIRDGKLIPLAVSTPSARRALPDVPTTLEAGFADSDYNYWMGMFVPAKTPRDIVERLHRRPRRRSAARRDGEIHAAGDRADADDAGRVRCADQEGDRRPTSRWSRRPASSSINQV